MICPLCHNKMDDWESSKTCLTLNCSMLKFLNNTNTYCLIKELGGIDEGKSVYYSKEEFDRLIKLKAFW
jgi:hypothetical protein